MDREEREKEAKELYQFILQSANGFLHRSKFFSIEILQAENPTYEEIATFALELAEIVRVLSDDFDSMLHQKALEYASIMHLMGKAIAKCDREELKRLIDQLDRKPMI
jgi:hypothetical protein